MFTTDVRDLDRDGLLAFGKAQRKQAPRRELGAWAPASDRPDPVEVLRAGAADRLPALAPIRIGRMAVDPFAFLRGSAEVMANDIGPSATSGIPVQVCGDAHLVNFGLFATTERNLVFDLNDFDETAVGAWEWDVLRLAASVVVAARANGMTADEGVGAARQVATSYRERMADLAELSALDRRYLRIDIDAVIDALRAAEGAEQQLKRTEKQVAKARRKDRFNALERFTEIRDGERVIVADPPLVQPLPHDTYREQLLALYAGYRSTLPSHVVALLDQHRFVDIALKVVGVGSVGTRAFMVLLAGRADLDPLFLQIKEASASVFRPWAAPATWSSDGQRVVEGQRLLQAAGDLFLGWGSADGRDYYVRQLRDMKGGADVARMLPAGLQRYAGLCAVALANAHGRSQQPALISGYLGTNDKADDAIARFAVSYADQTERDHAALVTAVRAGRIEATEGI
ncbi:MAG: DUF2252 domain-containing protein [Actinobacteria bacterium]|nr:DUF2252 domain-containing protein [Actinomycetota bacterium]